MDNELTSNKPTILKEYIKQYNGYDSDSMVEWSNHKLTPLWIHDGPKLIWIRDTRHTAGKDDYIVMPHNDFLQWTVIRKDDIDNYTLI